MKTLLLLLASIALTSFALAQEAPPETRLESFGWDAVEEPINGYELGTRLPPPGDWVVAGESITNEIDNVAIPKGEVQVAVRSFRTILNSLNEDRGRLESGWSEWLNMPEEPPIPGSLHKRIRVQIDIESSDNLIKWRPIAQHIISDTGQLGTEFVRAGMKSLR